MADVKISALPAATTPLAGTELVPIVQSGVTSKVSVDNLTAGKTVAASTVNVDANTASAAVRITQTGAGNALVVEDSASPDATPFVVTADGTVVVGNTAAGATAYDVQSLTGDGASYLAQRYVSGTGGSFIRLDKSRSATIGTNTIVNSGDTLGTVEFRGADGTSFVPAAQIVVAVDGTPGTNDMPGRLVFSTTADGSSSVTERMRIDNAGNVRVGTAALATTATNGFLYVPTCAGLPTGIPTAITGLAPIVVDSTNNKLYFYSGGAWRDAGP
jgi:hypothetical protein